MRERVALIDKRARDLSTTDVNVGVPTLDVNILGGSSSGTQYTEGATTSPAVGTAELIRSTGGALVVPSDTNPIPSKILSSVLPTGAATAANQTSPTTPINLNGSGSGAAPTVDGTPVTLTAPANAIGFILMNIDTSTTNMRWAVGRTATATLGQQLQPGRSSDFVPVGANVSIIAESGTVTYDVQWISR